jgi:hypothetical protein
MENLVKILLGTPYDYYGCHKSWYKYDYPFNLTIANAIITTEIDNKEIWRGHIDITKVSSNLLKLVSKLKTNLIVTQERSFPTDKENDLIITISKKTFIFSTSYKTYFSIVKNTPYEVPTEFNTYEKEMNYKISNKENEYLKLPILWDNKKHFMENIHTAWKDFFQQPLENPRDFNIDDFVVSNSINQLIHEYSFNQYKPRLNRNKFKPLLKEFESSSELHKLIKDFINRKDYSVYKRHMNIPYLIFPYFSKNEISKSNYILLLEIYKIFAIISRSTAFEVLEYPKNGSNTWIKDNFIYVNIKNSNIKRYLQYKLLIS